MEPPDRPQPSAESGKPTKKKTNTRLRHAPAGPKDAKAQPDVPAPAGTATGLVPASVSKKGLTKLNPGAVEFKPAAVATPSSPADAMSPTTDGPVDAVAVSNRNGKGGRGRADSKAGNQSKSKSGVKSSVPAALPASGETEDPSEVTCNICTDAAKYFAVGKCNHHICSMCAVRMRVKSKDKHCAICKEDLRMMIVFRLQRPKKGAASDPSAALRPFNSFGLSEADCDADHGNLPGVRVDPAGGFLFVDCAQHFTEMEQLRAIVCPIKSCQARFPTVLTLQKHLREIHENLALCSLCVENRPLFMSEHCVMNPKQLACHMKGEEWPGGSKGAVTTHTAGHPACEFCTERFFDKAALYYHMQRSYFTCHLCPRQHMFRYYVDAVALREHHHREHIVCHVCAAVPQLVDSGVAVAFRDAREYSDHMRQVHNTQVSALSGVTGGKTSFRLGASSTYQTVANNVRKDKYGRPRATVVDLDMGSANPNARVEEDRAVTRAQAAPTSRASDGAARLIPANMRIAGRVTGAGRFAALDSSDLLLQAAAEEYAAADLAAQRGGGKKSIRLDREQSFPALEGSEEPRSGVKAGVDVDLNSGKGWGAPSMLGTAKPAASAPPLPAKPAAPAAPAGLHPMSLLHAAKVQAKELQSRKEAEAAARLREEKQRQEERRIERNLTLASALLGSSVGQDARAPALTAADVGATLMNKSYVRSLVSPLEPLGWSESELMRSIYPPMLVSWARLNKVDLAKIEKKLYDLMTDPSLNSIQLKPMERGKRVVVHQLSRMYLLNSYEFDAEPSRYVSLVKQVDSYLPVCPLSRAAAMPAFALPGENGEELPDVPVIYLTLSSERYSAGLVNTNSSISAAGKRAAAGGLTGVGAEPVRIAFTVAEIVARVSGLLESPDLWRAWYQHAMLTGGQDLAEVPSQAGDVSSVPPPPPGFGGMTASPPAVPSAKPRALADLPLPRLTGLIAAGASSIGLRFADRSAAQLALQYMQYCLSLHTALGAAKGAPRTPVQAAVLAVASTLAPKQAQELTVLSVFNQHPGFAARTVTEIVFETPLSGTKGVPATPSESGTVSAALDRRHYVPKTSASPAESRAASTADSAVVGKAIHEGSWQHTAVKTRRFEGAGAMTAAVQDSWEDFEPADAPSEEPSDVPRKVSAAEPPSAEANEEWEQFLQDKRAKAQAEGAAPKYLAKRSEATAGKYVPPSARKQGGLQVVRPAGAGAAAAEVEGYDLCDRSLPPSRAYEDEPAAAVAAVYATDYLDSEADFEEFLRKTRLEHVSSHVRAVPLPPGGPAGAALGGVAAHAVPIRDDMSEEEAARMVLRHQLQRDRQASQLNRFGVLDEDEDDDVDG